MTWQTLLVYPILLLSLLQDNFETIPPIYPIHSNITKFLVTNIELYID